MERNCFVCGKTVNLYGFDQLKDEEVFCLQCWIEDRLPKHFYLYNWRALEQFNPTRRGR